MLQTNGHRQFGPRTRNRNASVSVSKRSAVRRNIPMKHALIRRTITLLVFSLATSPILSLRASAGERPAVAAASSAQSGSQNFSDAELDELLGPIALYPDPLLAQVLPAATFVDQIDEAERVLKGRTDNGLIDRQTWDVSVKSIAHYPAVLSMMNQKRDWAITLGQAYVNQSTDVIKSVQRLRAEARSAGSLITTPQQQIIVDGQTIRIVPAQPQVIYVPQYSPEVVYVKEEQHGVSTGAAVAAAAISFGAGLAIGAWLNRDWDWHGGGIYYHGWTGGGWIGANRTFVNVNRNIYVNNSFRNVNVNRTVVNRNVTNYRTDLNRRVTTRTDRRYEANRRDIGRTRSDSLRNTSNDRLDAHRGRDNSRQVDSRNQQSMRQVSDNRARTGDNSHSAFGGIGTRDKAKEEHNRGLDSRQKMGGSHDGGMRKRENSDRGGQKLGGGRRGGRRP